MNRPELSLQYKINQAASAHSNGLFLQEIRMI